MKDNAPVPPPPDEPVSQTLGRLGYLARWQLRSRCYLEGTLQRAPQRFAFPDGRDKVSVFGAPPQLATSLPARVWCRYLRGRDPGPAPKLADAPTASGTLAYWLDAGDQDFDSIMQRLEAATQYVVELVLDIDAGDQAVCREVVVRPPQAPPGLSWQQYGSGVVAIDHQGTICQPEDHWFISGLPDMPIRKITFECVAAWRRATGTKLPKRRRGFTPDVLSEVTREYRHGKSRSKVALAMGWVDGAGWPNRDRAKRAIHAAVEDGYLSASERDELRDAAPQGRPKAVGKSPV